MAGGGAHKKSDLQGCSSWVIMNTMNNYIDAHCHLDAGAVSGARDASGYICTATREEQWAPLASWAASDQNKWAAIGIHPWDVATITPGWDARMADLLRASPELMVGEIGLDRGRDNWNVQVDIFARQMEIATRFQRSVHVHCVRAWDVLLAHLKNMRVLPPVILLHGFLGNQDIAQQLMRYRSIYFSFRRVTPVVTVVPENRILVESDGRRDVLLGDIVRDISARRGGDMTAPIYNNTLQVVKHG